jgi:hypothetical protein
MDGEPDVLYGTWSGNVGEGDRLVSGQVDTRGNFPALPELSRRQRAGACCRHAALAFGASGIFRTDGVRTSRRQPPQIAQVDTQAIKGRFHSLPPCYVS